MASSEALLWLLIFGFISAAALLNPDDPNVCSQWERSVPPPADWVGSPVTEEEELIEALLVASVLTNHVSVVSLTPVVTVVTASNARCRLSVHGADGELLFSREAVTL